MGNRLLKSQALRRLDLLIADVNIMLATVAVCLAVLDATVFATLLLSDTFFDRHGIGTASAAYAVASFGRLH